MNKHESKNLIQVCNWKYLDNVAIEHHYSIDNSYRITYRNIRNIKNALKRILNDVKSSSSSQFIGISSDIPIFCIPTIILGIISSGHAFVYLSSECENLLLNDTCLNIQYIFSHKNFYKAINSRIIKRFIMHKQRMILVNVLKNNIQQCDNHDDEQNDTQYINDKNYFAYAITTSGSTGSPSIVRVTHNCIKSNIIDLKRIFNLTNTDKIVHLTPLSFDPSVIEIFLNFTIGGTLLTVTNKLKNNPKKLLYLLDNNCATFLSTTPSLLLHRWSISNINLTLLGKNSKLRILLLGGEPFPNHKTILKLKHRDNCTRIFNIYGITEVSCWSSINEIYINSTNNYAKTIDINYNSIGCVLSDTIFQVRNPNDNNIITDGDGLLYIGSNTRICAINNENYHDLIPPIYRNTGDLVTINRDNGMIKYIGRYDNCIKKFGIKIYLNIIEDHIKKLNFIDDTHGLFINDTSKLHIFFTIIDNKQLSNDEIDIFINNIWCHIRELPIINHPDNIHYIKKFTITQHGKICYDTLKKLSSINNINNNNIKWIFQSIWMKHLSPSIETTVENKSLRFLDNGGTSIMAIVISNELIDCTNCNYPELIGMLLENNTLYDCENYIIKQYNNINSSLVKNNDYYNCNDGNIVTENITHKLINNTNNICHWQKSRGKTINYYSNLELNNVKLSNIDNDKLSLNYIDILYNYDLNKCIDASPTLFKYISNDDIYVTVGSHSGIICTVNTTNNKYWYIKLPNRIEASILIMDNFKGIVGCHDGFIYCIDLITGKIYWKYHTRNIIKCLAVMCSEKRNIFIGSYDRFVYCISIENGNLIWKQCIGSVCATPIIHDETKSIIFVSLNGICSCLDQCNGTLRWNYQFNSPIFSSPAVINNNMIIIIGDVNGNVQAIDINNGNKLWNIEILENIFSDITTIYNNENNKFDNILITTKNGNVYRYNFINYYNNPQLLYKINCNSSIFASPWIDNDKLLIIIAQENGELKVFNLNTGQIITTFKLNGECFSSPIVYNNQIFIGCRDNNLYILSIK